MTVIIAIDDCHDNRYYIYQMTQFIRKLNLTEDLVKKSHFLFGPRSTGKTYLIREQIKNHKVIDLLNTQQWARYSKRPSLLFEESQNAETIVIDEIQKLPELLNEVHRCIEEKKIKFLLTGSSARKLKRGQANLLAGRAWQREIFPLVSDEIPNFNLNQYLIRGGLPHIYPSIDYELELRAYSDLYLKEEIQAEALTRNVFLFSHFLETIALQSGEELYLEGIASDSGVKVGTVRNYLEILEDTLLGFRLQPFRFTKKRKAISRSKFYLFDIGVRNSLIGIKNIPEKGPTFGQSFEHFIIQELRAFLSYSRINHPLQYWRSKSGFEVDCIINDTAIEIKSSELISEKHLKGLKALREEQLLRRYIIVSRDEHKRSIDGVEIIPWQNFLQSLWKGELF